MSSSPAYRPVASAVDWLSWQLLRGGAVAQHSVEVALHALVALLLLRALVLHGASRGAAVTAGIIFAVHPVVVGAVAPIGARPVLVALAALLFAIGEAARSRPGLAAVALGFVGSLVCVLSHEALALVPLVLVAAAAAARPRALGVAAGGVGALATVALLPVICRVLGLNGSWRC